MTLFWLLFAHFIGDVALQSHEQSEIKAKNIYAMISHCSIWTGCVGIALILLKIDFTIGKAVFLFCGHLIMDWYKCSQRNYEEHVGLLNLIDQTFHLFQIVMVSL